MTRDSNFSECVYHPEKTRLYIFLKGERWVRSIALSDDYIEVVSADGVLRKAEFSKNNVIVDTEDGKRLLGSIPKSELAKAITQVDSLKVDSKFTLNDVMRELRPLLKHDPATLGEAMTQKGAAESATATRAGEATIEVRGSALHLFQGANGHAPESATITDSKTVERIHETMMRLWRDSKKCATPMGLATSMELVLTLPDKRTATLLASEYCAIGDETRQDERFRELSILILRGVADNEQWVWSPGAVNTPYPSDEDRREIISRITNRQKSP